MSTIAKPAERAAWLAARHNFYNASDAGALYSVHPFKSLADVAIEKLQPEPTDNGTTDAMDRGNRLEPVLLDWFGDQHGCRVQTPDVLFTEGRLMATLDGEIVGVNDSWIEAKTTAQRWDEPPLHVYYQIVAQAAATQRTHCWLVWLDSSMRLQDQLIVPDPADVADVLERSARFMDWIDCGLLPEDVELGAEHVKALFPQHAKGQWRDLEEDEFLLVTEWSQARRARLDAEAAEDALKDRVAALIGECEGVRFGGSPVATFRAPKPSDKFDAARFMRENPDIANEYTRPVPGGRRLLPTGEAAA